MKEFWASLFKSVLHSYGIIWYTTFLPLLVASVQTKDVIISLEMFFFALMHKISNHKSQLWLRRNPILPLNFQQFCTQALLECRDDRADLARARLELILLSLTGSAQLGKKIFACGLAQLEPIKKISINDNFVKKVLSECLY